MADAKYTEHDTLPKAGRVNELCQEWVVREDGALAYQLQNQEINEHYSGNKFRNAVVREDFPKALNEQQREQQLAEQAAAIYHKMLAEQEELDKQVAKQLAEKLEREERLKRRALEVRDENIVRQLLDKERQKVEQFTIPPRMHHSPKKLPPPPPPQNYPQQPATPRRHAALMPLPSHELSRDELYTEPYKSNDHDIQERLSKLDITEIGVPVDEVIERQIQEEKDAELARKLQEQENQKEPTQVDRDRMLAIEAQDKELAKMLQERERAKAKRAKEKAKQKALVKKQQQQMQQMQHDPNSIMPDDSYSYPADVLPQNSANAQKFSFNRSESQEQYEEDLNYSFPVDVLQKQDNKRYPLQRDLDQLKSNSDAKILNCLGPSECHSYNENVPPPVRPTQLDLRLPHNSSSKPRYPDPQSIDSTSPVSYTSPTHHVNIAMAIDPTYPRRQGMSPLSYDTSTTSGTVTSTSSSSPGFALPPPDVSELEEETSPVPPYMPIQGQRRTASLEKKTKKKNKDGGCKQQ